MNHKDLEVWKKSIDLVKQIYAITSHFPKSEMFGLVSQQRRAAVSVPSNIAEGTARRSDKELIQFLYIGLGSISELETLIIISSEMDYIDNIAYQNCLSRIEKIRSMLLGLIRYLKNKNK